MGRYVRHGARGGLVSFKNLDSRMESEAVVQTIAERTEAPDSVCSII